MTAYIGDSTRSELAYAFEHGKPIRFLEEPVASLEWELKQAAVSAPKP